MAEEEFHEIQLNGKQLVFLFMAGTVAAVVIFLCGLMVGRNLRAPKLEVTASAAEPAIVDPTRSAEQAPPPADGTDDGKPAVINEPLSYPKQLEPPIPQDEAITDDPTAKITAKAAPSAKPAPVAEKAPLVRDTPKEVTKEPVSQPRDAPRKEPAAAAAAPPEPPGNGWTVQVVAPKTREEADVVARRLAAKGYPAFVTPRGSGALLRYGVRVGKYENRHDADAMKARLEKDEQFKPWVTR